MADRSRIKLPFTAWIAILSVIGATTVGPIMIRAAQLEGVPSIYIIAIRLLLTALVLAPIVLPRDGEALWQMQQRDWLWTGLAALFLTINLFMLFLALEYTSVLVTGILRRITPLWVIGMEILFLAVAFSTRVWVGLLITIVGSTAVALGSEGAVEPGSAPVLGATLAIIGSICMGFYLLIGRKLRDVLPSLAYSWLVFLISGILALIVVLVTRTPLWGYTFMGYVWILGVTIIAQLIGHVALNQTLQHVPATYISLIMQLSIVSSGVVAFFTFNQIPSVWQMAGSVAVMVGVMVATGKQESAKPLPINRTRPIGDMAIKN